MGVERSESRNRAGTEPRTRISTKGLILYGEREREKERERETDRDRQTETAVENVSRITRGGRNIRQVGGRVFLFIDSTYI